MASEARRRRAGGGGGVDNARTALAAARERLWACEGGMLGLREAGGREEHERALENQTLRLRVRRADLSVQLRRRRSALPSLLHDSPRVPSTWRCRGAVVAARALDDAAAASAAAASADGGAGVGLEMRREVSVLTPAARRRAALCWRLLRGEEERLRRFSWPRTVRSRCTRRSTIAHRDAPRRGAQSRAGLQAERAA